MSVSVDHLDDEHRDDLRYLANNHAISVARLYGRRLLVRTAKDFSLAILDFDSLEEIDFHYIGSEIMSINVIADYIVVGCMRGAVALKWHVR
jgi:hypothetical protein